MKRAAFTLIELLIVVAIIAILAAIAVPNFLEAQVRAKISRCKADLRTIDLAYQTYLVDYNAEPRVSYGKPPGSQYSNWWGWVSWCLTTPVSYLTSMPIYPFRDTVLVGMWKNVDPVHNSQGNQPYTVIRYLTHPARDWPVGTAHTSHSTLFKDVLVPQPFVDECKIYGYLVYVCGPDNQDSTAFRAPAYYDPSNGTISFGDIYRFGVGKSEGLQH